MKCAVCGKEFGSGINCQSCGVDKVTGLANYSGYDNSAGNSHLNSSNTMEYASNRTTACYACGEIIPSDAEYCPYCRKKLYETCPKCGKKYSSQFDNCPRCGTNRHDYYLKLEAKKQEERRIERIKEEEAKLRNEAYELKNQLEEGLYQKIYYLIGVIGAIVGSIIGIIILGDYAAPLVTFFLGFLAFWYPVRIYVYYKSKDNVEKWKEQHLNDPRSKYL